MERFMRNKCISQSSEAKPKREFSKKTTNLMRADFAVNTQNKKWPSLGDSRAFIKKHDFVGKTEKQVRRNVCLHAFSVSM